MSFYRIATAGDPHGKYRLITELGRGGTSNVYLAIARGVSGFNKVVVLKTSTDELADNPEFHALFLAEARLAARLSHPNVVQTYEVAVENGVPMIVMEYLNGQPLSSVLRRTRGTLPVAAHVRILIEALAGLHYAHELVDFDGAPLGVVHRDVTPQNVFVTFDGQVKIVDFGIAKLANSLVQTQTGVVKGKTRYMPPEQLTGDAIDRRADIFAMGVMLWDAAAGTMLWNGLTDAAITNRVLNGDIPRPSSVNPEAPKALESICMKALAVDPGDRYATAAALEEDLEEVIGDLGGPVSLRRLGKELSESFSDVRARTKALLDAELAKLGVPLLTLAEPAKVPSTPAPRAVGRGLPRTPSELTFTRDPAADSVFASAPSPAHPIDFRPLGWAAVSVAALAVGGWLWNGASPHAAGTAVRAPTSPVLAGVDPPPNALLRGLSTAPEQIQIRVVTEPSSAQVFLDDVPLEANPFARAVPRDGKRHLLRAQAEGYEPRSLAVVFERDADILMALERAAPRRPRVAPPLSPPSSSSSSAATESTCAAPYYIDERGIKKWKPECL